MGQKMSGSKKPPAKPQPPSPPGANAAPRTPAAPVSGSGVTFLPPAAPSSASPATSGSTSTGTATTRNVQFCYKCGSRNPKNAQHCNQCGAILTSQGAGLPWGSIIGWALGLLAIAGVLYAFKLAGNVVNSDGTLSNPIKVTKKITKEDLEDQIKTGLNKKLAGKQTDIPAADRMTCTRVELVKDSETDASTKYTGFAEFSDGGKTDVVATIDKDDGSLIWKTGDGVS
jgi:hypothetical protein